MRTICFEKKIPKFLLTRALRPLWRDAVFSPLSPTRVLDLPDGPLPGPRWVRVRNRLGGICASDLHLLYLKADPRVAPAALPGTDRMYMGHELVGEVVEVGAQVTALQPGERVILDAESPNCLNQELTSPCRHCREGNLAPCENASLGQGSQTLGGGWGFVTHRFPLARWRQAVRTAHDKTSGAIKVVLDCQAEAL